MAAKTLWTRGWEFVELPLEEASYAMPDTGFCPVAIPHDWLIYDCHGLYRDSIGWYRKKFAMEELPADRQYLIWFDGVYMDSTVYVNGQEACSWKYGYSAFELDVTPFLRAGENEIAVRVVYQSPNSRWYSGAGIFRNIWWKERETALHLVTCGAYITPVRETEEVWKVELDTEVVSGGEDCRLVQRILDGSGACVAEGSAAVSGAAPSAEASGDAVLFGKTAVPAGVAPAIAHITNLGENSAVTVSQKLTVQGPALWDIAQGNLYTLETRLYRGEELVETEAERFGFRTFVFDPDRGFLLNGRKLRVNGVCEHHDLGSLGAAFHIDAMRRKFETLRSMGVNAVRTSHNMPAAELMDLADELGFLVDSEAFDMWERSKTTYDYGRFFKDWHSVDVASWIRRDRNRVSVLMWSIGNEIPDTVESAHGVEITRYLLEALRPHDPKRHAPTTIGSNFMKWENGQNCEDLVDLAGYNYSEYLYEEHHRQHPDWVIYGSETASVLASRGVYHFPREQYVLTDDDEQCSALGNSITGWGAKSYEACICDDRDCEFSIGQFIWTGFDYIGEPTPYDTKNSYFGQLDTAGFPKDSFYIFQAEWTDYRVAPMVHVYPYWDFNPGQIIDIGVCSNCPEVELFVNGKSLGRRRIDHGTGISGKKSGMDRGVVQQYQAAYEPGELVAVAYDENGNELARDRRTSFGDAVKLQAKVERVYRRLAFVQITALDREGRPVENAGNRVFVTVEKPAGLLGLDNGDSADFDDYKGESRRLFRGMLLAVVELPEGAFAKEAVLQVTSPGLEAAKVVIALPEGGQDAPAQEAAEATSGRALYAGGSKGAKLADPMEIPVRKITLRVYDEETGEALSDRALTADRRSVILAAEISPADATYRELEWKAVTDTGIELSSVTLEELPEAGGMQRRKLTALGDGSFRLRCISRNGGSVASVQSNLEFEAAGIGAAWMDPYEEVLCGLCSYRNETVAEGVEHGINFLGASGECAGSVIGFDNVDFGTAGTKSVTMSVFANTNDPVKFQIWRGAPDAEGSELLLDATYHKPPQWMVFQPETYELENRLTGRCALYFVTQDSFQFRAFVCEKLDKARLALHAAECEHLYGDSFVRNGDKVEKIGNNVTFVYEEMDFGAEGAGKLTVCAHTDLAVNPIQIRFTPADLTPPQIQMVEVKGSASYGEQTFELTEPLRGMGTVEFIFLPGSNLDFDWFRFT